MNPLFGTRIAARIEEEYALPHGWFNPKVDFSGEDGNGALIVAVVVRALRVAGNSDEVVNTFIREATRGSYDDLLVASYHYAGMGSDDLAEPENNKVATHWPTRQSGEPGRAKSAGEIYREALLDIQIEKYEKQRKA